MDKVKNIIDKLGIPRLIIISFLLLLFIIAIASGLAIPPLIGDSIRRVGMAGILVLAMIPTIRAGMGLNFGLPLGIVCGLLGSLISVQFNFTGFTGFFMAIIFALPFAIITGIGYAWLLAKVKGQEMMVGTYVGFSSVAFMNMMWLVLPFTNPEIIWPIGGTGLRYTISLVNHFSGVLSDFLKLSIGQFEVPTGLILFFVFFCVLLYFFFKTKIGLAIDATGANEMYAISSGINVKKMRTTAVVISNCLAAIGIIAYAQSYGFLQLYNGPMFMAFPAVAAILIGGASLKKATISNVIIGTILFQTLLTISLPVTSQVVDGDISEVARLIISNGMIVYALTRGNKKGGK
jgi:simple sugar transport system permease protein